MAQVLSQEEVDALLRGVSDGEIETETDDPIDEDGVVTYDIANQERIIRGKMPTLDIINQRFARLFRNTLSTSLRQAVDVNPLSTDTVKFGKFIKSLPVPTSLHIFRMDPLRGFALLVAESKLVFSLVELFFGGVGSSSMKIEGRDFTTIEQKMIKKIIDNALDNLEQAWTPVHEIKVSYVRSEVNPQFATVVPQTDVVIVVTFEVELEQSSGTITMCFPYSTIEPIVGKLKAGFQSDQLEVDHSWAGRLLERFSRAKVEVVSYLGQTQITASDLMNLKVGDVIPLEQDIAEEIVVNIEGIPKFKGHPGVYKSTKAIKISRLIRRKGDKKNGGK